MKKGIAMLPVAVAILAAAAAFSFPAITGYFAQITGASSSLVTWSSADSFGGGPGAAFINEQVRFYANFTSLAGDPVTGAVSCTIRFIVNGSLTDPAAMSYNATSQLYEYNRTFTFADFYYWNATCDGISEGGDILTAQDNVTVRLYEWWNNSWEYRVRIDVQNGVATADWPVEVDLNLTDVVRQVYGTGTFDDNSTRVVEYNSTGSPLYEIPSQFDKDEQYSAAGSASGTAVFMLNGTTQANEKRTFYLYFGTTENGLKAPPSYATDLQYSWIGDEIQVDTTGFSFHFDTNRSENSSGLYQMEFRGYPVPFFTVDETERTVEYSEYSNGTYNFSFGFYANTRVVAGPVRLTIIEEGDELMPGTTSPTGEGKMVRMHHFYEKAGNETLGAMFKVRQNYTNTASYQITRNSTAAGAIAFDAARGWTYLGSTISFYISEPTDPNSWSLVASDNLEVIGLVHINESVGGFSISNTTDPDRVGVELQDTAISAGASITDLSAVYVGSGSTSEFVEVRDILSDPPAVTSGAYEPLVMVSNTSTEYSFYNRNETIIVQTNVSYDPYGVFDSINLTLNNATPSTADDIVVEMQDDGVYPDQAAGDRIYTATYNITITEHTGTWTAQSSIYDSDGVRINTSSMDFILTSELYLNTSVINRNGEVNRIVTSTVDVLNYRQDAWQGGAQVGCSVYDDDTFLYAVDASNITVLSAGRFEANFTAPSYFGVFTLNCTAGLGGNNGSDISDFGAEDVETFINITAVPEIYTATNVTWLAGESFMLRINSANVHNGTAYNATVQLQLPENMTANATSYMCLSDEGDYIIMIARTCHVDFNVTILATTAPSNFTLNASVSWNNSDQSNNYNSTSMNVTVNPTYVMQVPENNITSMIVWQMKKNVANVTVKSLGNAPLENVTFNVSGMGPDFNFTFGPENFSSLPAGNQTQFMVWLEVFPSASTGTYNGTLNVSSINDGHKVINVSITVSGTNVSLDAWPLNFTAENITYYAGQNFSFEFNATNIGNNTAYTTNMTFTSYNLPYINTSNSTTYPCGNVEPSQSCYGSFVILVSNGTPSGNYIVNVSVGWGNEEMGIQYNWSEINITVLSNVSLTIPEDDINGSVTHNTTVTIGNFTLNSTGNDPVRELAFTLIDPTGNLSRFSITFIPNLPVTQGGTVNAGQIAVILVNASVPVSYPNGTYPGFISITTSNSGNKTLGFNITVPQTRTWNISTTSCEHAESPLYGTACNVSINNTGNVPITFSIQPASTSSSMNNHTWPSVTSFTVGNQSGTYITFYYNVTGAELTFYNSSYNFTAVRGIPGSRNISIMLTPFVKPIISLNVTPSTIAQSGSVQIIAYVTDQGGVAGINFTMANVTRPDGTVDIIRMRYVTGTDPYIYQEFYPLDPLNGTWGSSAGRGNYTVVAYAEDNVGLNETANASFYAYAVLSVTLDTSRASREYFQGETGTILYTVTDTAGYAIGGANATVYIKDPTNRSVNMQDSAFISDSQGEPPSYPSFELFSDSQEGTYTATAVSYYNDTAVSVMVQNSTTVDFTVTRKEPRLVTLDLEAPSEVSTSDGLIVFATVTDGSNNFDPDWVRVSLYDSMDNVILDNVTMTQESTGRFSRTFNTSISVNTGTWRWSITAAEGQNTVTKDVFTRLVGGLFDVRDINPFDRAVSILGISAVIENTGDIPQDAFIQWNLTRVDTGESIQQGMDTVRINAATEYTYTINPSGVSYIGNVRILFVVTYSGTETAAAYEFFATEAEAPTEPEEPGPGGGGGKPPPEGGGGGGAGGGPVGAPGMEITNYPAEIATEAGWTQYPSITINNSGTTSLHNIRVKLEGIPSSWYNVSPVMIPVLNPGVTVNFVFSVYVPPGTQAREYYGTINATADEASAIKFTAVVVFGSREELVRYQLARLKEEFADFKDDVNATAKRGEKDLTRVYGIIEEIEHQIEMTEGYLDARMFNEALDAVTTGWRLLDRGRELLRDAPPLEPMTLLAIPDWMLTVILILVIVVLLLVVVMNRSRKKLDKVFAFRKKAPAAAADAMESAGEVLSEKMPSGPSKMEMEAAESSRKEEEKKKIEKLLSLLEKEYNEGIISEKAYNDLRNRNLEKLKAQK